MEEILVIIGIFVACFLLASLVYYPLFRWLVIVSIGIAIYLKIVKPKIQEKKEEQEFEHRQKAYLENQRIQEETERMLQNRIIKVRAEMQELNIYELNIIPFLSVVMEQDVWKKTTSPCIIDVNRNYAEIETHASQLNATAEALNLSDRVLIHS